MSLVRSSPMPRLWLPARGSEVSAYATNDTDLIIDINGYFAPAGTGGLSLYTVAPCRVIDTRHVGNGQPFSGTLNPPVDVGGSVCGHTGHGAGLCLQCNGGADGQPGLPDVVARRSQPAYGLDLERRWMDPSPATWQSCPAPTARSMLMRMGSRNWSSTSPATSRHKAHFRSGIALNLRAEASTALAPPLFADTDAGAYSELFEDN